MRGDPRNYPDLIMEELEENGEQVKPLPEYMRTFLAEVYARRRAEDKLRDQRKADHE